MSDVTTGVLFLSWGIDMKTVDLMRLSGLIKSRDIVRNFVSMLNNCRRLRVTLE
jgi:hypothetical protein